MREDRRLDGYEKTFSRGEEDALLREVREMEAESEWVPGIPSAGMHLEAIDGPLFAQETARKYRTDYELTLDTAQGTGLMLDIGGRWELLRETARSSLCETAKLGGSALGRMSPYLLAQTLNNALSVARGSTLMLRRCGKASALHSCADGGYQILPLSGLLDISTDMIRRRFGTGDFIRGSCGHGMTTAVWELPDAQMRLLDRYRKALGQNGSRYPVNYMPVLRFASSDTGASSAVLEPLFWVPRTDSLLRFTDGARVRHTKRGAKPAMKEFEEQAEGIFARFEESAKVIAELASVTIYNGINCVVSLCGRYGIARKYGEAARVEMERLTSGGCAVTAHDLYLCMSATCSATGQQ